MTKRTAESRDETDRELDVSEVTKASPRAKIHGIMSKLSPMKKSCSTSYFDGQLTDGKGSMRMYGFVSGVRRKLWDMSYETTKTPEAVLLTNCEVKESDKTGELQVLVTKDTQVLKSEKEFDVNEALLAGSTSTDSGGKTITLNEINDCSQYDRVCAKVKAVKVDAPMQVSGGKRKQDVLVRDETGSARFTVWETEIDKIKEGCCYELSGVMVREYLRQRFLSTSKHNCLIEEIEDIGAVIEEDADTSENNMTVSHRCMDRMKNVCVVGVNHLDRYCRCLKCKGRVEVDMDDETLGHCVKCKMTMILEGLSEEMSAQITVRGTGGMKTLRVLERL